MRALTVFVALGFSCSAAGADVPPTLAFGKVQGGNLVLDVTKQVPVQEQIVVTVLVNGQPVQETRTVTVLKTVQLQQQVALKGAKATSGGKALTEKELAEKLSENRALVTSTGPIPEKYKKLFKDDAILIEFPEPQPAPRG